MKQPNPQRRPLSLSKRRLTNLLRLAWLRLRRRLVTVVMEEDGRWTVE